MQFDMNPGVVLCSRLQSRRIKNKPLVNIAGKPALALLLERLKGLPFPVCLAIPNDAENDILASFSENVFRGHGDNPLARFFFAANENNYDPVIRITHDDILQDHKLIKMMTAYHHQKKADYTYVSDVIRGMDCEIVGKDLVERAWRMYRDKPVEHLSYAFRHPDLNAEICQYNPPAAYRSHCRMSLDYPDDINALNELFQRCRINSTGPVILQTLKTYPYIQNINNLPALTVYTCAYNAEKTIRRTIESVLSQSYTDYEYIILDDGSTDETMSVISTFGDSKKVRVIASRQNNGLASSCNAVLNNAKGRYALRIDADDELLPDALDILMKDIESENNGNIAAIYPAYVRNGKTIKNTDHHIGGALFRMSIIQEIKFCDGLRHYEGKELFSRLSGRYSIKELDIPTWVYHDTNGSLSNNVTSEREHIKTILG